MCLNVIVASKIPLSIIKDNKNYSGFYIERIIDQNTINSIHPILKSSFYYQVGSFMGCSCGLSFGKWSQASPNENHTQRKKDVMGFHNYLAEHAKNNQLKLFCTWWDHDFDSYKSIPYDPSSVSEIEFDFPENIILEITAKTIH